MCWTCGRWAIFDEKRQLRKPTGDEMAQLGRMFDLPRMHTDWVEEKSAGLRRSLEPHK